MTAESKNNNKYYEDGTNYEGVDPSPSLNWKSVEDLKTVVVHGPKFSHGTSKIRCFLMHSGIPFQHATNPKEDPQGCKLKYFYRKVPIVDVDGRQVNDSGVIMKYLAPAVGMTFHPEWEERIVYELDTALRFMFRHLIGPKRQLPRLMFWPIGLFIWSLEKGQAKLNTSWELVTAMVIRCSSLKTSRLEWEARTSFRATQLAMSMCPCLDSSLWLSLFQESLRDGAPQGDRLDGLGRAHEEERSFGKALCGLTINMHSRSTRQAAHQSSPRLADVCIGKGMA